MEKNPPAMWETWVRSLDQEDPLEEGMATHSSILAWRIPMARGAWWATVHGILQARILEWGAFPFSRGLPNPGLEPSSPALQVDSLPAEPPGKPKNTGVCSLSLLQGIFPTPGIELGSPPLQVDSLPTELGGKPPREGVGRPEKCFIGKTEFALTPKDR